MGMPTAEELTEGGPPIRVCLFCKTDDDTHDGHEPTDIGVRSTRGRWDTCKRCGRRSRHIWLVDRKPTDERTKT